MSENPYQSPVDIVPAVKSDHLGQEDLRSVISAHRMLIVIFYTYPLVPVIQVVVPREFHMFVPLVYIGLGLISIVFILQLARRISNLTMGVLFSIFALVPCVGFFIIGLVCRSATKTLRKHGLVVDAFGANPTKSKRRNPFVPPPPA